MLIEGNSIGEIYPKLLEHLLNQGLPASPRGQATYESLAVQLHCPDILQNILVHPVRDLNYVFLVAEWLWIMAGREDLKTLVMYNRHYAKYSDNGKTLAGAYGPRLRKMVDNTYWTDQFTWVITKLRADPDSRQAVASIWLPAPYPSKDISCTLSLQFILRTDHLHLIVTMRSSDAWLGLPYDWFTMTMIANCIAGELSVKTGSVTFQLGSSHLYEQHKEKAVELVARYMETSTTKSPVLSNLPDCDYFDQVLTCVNPIPIGLQLCYWQVLHQPGRFTKAKALEILNAAS